MKITARDKLTRDTVTWEGIQKNINHLGQLILDKASNLAKLDSSFKVCQISF